MNATKENPYIGPQPFQESERELFFGREQESNELLALALSEQEIVFYAQSGAGKSSLVNTCLIPDLKKKGFEVLLARVGGDVPTGLAVGDKFNIFVFNLLRRLSTGEVDLHSLTGLSLSKFLVPWTDDENDSAGHVSSRRALIIDQFEEIFSTHHEAWEKRREFFEQLAEALEADPRLRVILVMREDFVASLDPYANSMPGRLRMRYYMQRLEYAAALMAVKEPVKGKEFSRPYEAGAAEKLVDDLRSIKVIKPDGKFDIGMGQFVEPLYLQVICYELWSNLPADGKTITRKNVEDVGDVSTSLGNYYARRVATVAAAQNVKEGKIRKWFTEELISAAGIRNMVLEEPGQTSANLENRVIRALSDLVRAEQRGGAVFYELTHDRLVEPIIESNRKWFDEHLSPLQKQAALWDKQGRTDSWLLSDQALVEVEAWADEHPDEVMALEREFLETCHLKQEEKEDKAQREADRKELEAAKKLMDEQARAAESARKLANEQVHSATLARRFTLGAVALMIVAVIASIFAFGQTTEANTQREQADIQRAAAQVAESEAKVAEDKAVEKANVALSGQLSAFALNKLSSQPDLAILLSLAADKLFSDINSRNALLTMQQETAAVKSFLSLEMSPDEVQFSPDGTIVASRDENGVTFWDTTTLEKLNEKPFNDHYSGVTAWALSKDGAWMASGGADGTIVIWDAIERKPISGPFKSHKGRLTSLVFNEDGTKLASASWDESSIILWDITNPAEPQAADEPLLGHGGTVASLAFSPDGRTLASGGDGIDPTIILWDVETQQAIGEPLAGHNDLVISLAFTPDGKILASGSYDYTNILWDVSDLEKTEKIGEPLADEIYIDVIAISPDGKMLASGNDNGDILLWDISDSEKPTLMGTLHSDTSWIVSLAFSRDGKTLVSGSLDGKVLLWNIGEQTKIGETLSAHKDAVYGVGFLSQGESLITASEDSYIKFWDVTDRENPEPDPDPDSLQGHLGSPTGIGFSADGSLLTSLGDEGTIFFEVASQQNLGYGDFLPTGANTDILAYQIAVGSKVTVYVKEIPGGNVKNIPISGTNPILSPNGKILVYQTTGTESNPFQLHIWDITTNKESPNRLSGENPVFSSDGQVLVYYTKDPETGEDWINLWDIARSEGLGDPVPGTFLGISSDEKILIYTTFDPETGDYLINQWDVPNARPQGESISSSNYSISENGELLAVQSFDQNTEVSSIKILSTVTGETLESSSREGELIALNYDGRYLFYQTKGPSGNKDNVAFINLGDTRSGINIGDPIEGGLVDNGGNAFRVFEAGTVLAFEVQDEDANTQLVLIDTSSNQLIDVIDEAVYRAQTSDGGILVYQAGNEINLLDTTTQLTIGPAIKGDYLGISPDGKFLASHNGSGLVTFWDLARSWPLGSPVQNVPDEVSRAVLSQDGSALAWIDEDGLMVLSGTTRVGPYNDHQTGIISGSYPAFSLNGELLAAGDYEPQNVTLWDLQTGQPVASEFSCCWPALSPDGKLLAIGDFNTENTTVWDVDSQEPIWDELPGVFPAFSPDGKQLAIGNRGNNTTAFWDVNTREPVGGELPGVFPAFSPDGRLVAVGDWNPSATTIWDVNTYTRVGDEIPGVLPAFSSDGKLLAVGDFDSHNTILWDVDTRQPVGKELSDYYFPAFSPDGKVLTAGSENTHLITVWGIDAKTRLTEPSKKFRPLPEDFVLSSNGEHLASILPDDVVIRDLDANTSRRLDFGEYTGQLNGPIHFYADDSRFASIGSDGTLLTWDVDSGRLTMPDEENQPPQLQGDAIKTFSPTGDYLAYFNGADINIWDVRNGKLYSRLKEAEIEESLGALAFSPDGKWLVYSDGPRVVLWDTQNQKMSEDTLLTEAVAINELNLITADDEVTYVVATDDANVTQIWDWKSRTKVGNPMQDLSIVGLDTQNRFAFYTDPKGRLVQWQWGTNLTKLLCPLVKRNFTQEEWTRYFPDMEYPTDNLTCPDYPVGE